VTHGKGTSALRALRKSVTTQHKAVVLRVVSCSFHVLSRTLTGEIGETVSVN
jgi:hypothetical protein